MKRIIVIALLLSACGLHPAPSGAPAGGGPQPRFAAATPTATAPRPCPVGSTVVVVGDSITVYAAAAIDKALRDAEYDPAINAHGGRTIGQGADTVLGYAALPTPARCWVIALGTNDTWQGTPATWQAAISDLAAPIPAGEPAWWVGLGALAAGDTFNPLVPYPVIQWKPTAPELQADGTHPTPAGVKLWVSNVMSALTGSRDVAF